MIAKKKKQNKPKAKESKNFYVYADIETLVEEGNEAFWYGCLCNGTDDDYKIYDDFKSFFLALTEPIKDKRKVVVFHNAKFDISYIQYHAKHELGFEYNPKEKGRKNAIYEGQHAEIYTNNLLMPTYIVDSAKLLPGSLAAWGDYFNLPKGETPLVTHYRKPNDIEIAYIKRDVEILKIAFQSMGHEESVDKGYLTTSSRTQGSLNDRYNEKKNKRHKNGSLKRKYSTDNSQKSKLPIPTSVSKQIKRDLSVFIEKERDKSENEKGRLYGINNEVTERYRKELQKYWVKKCSEEVVHFKTKQKQIKKLLELDNDKLSKDDRDGIRNFFNIPLPKGESPKGEWIIDDYHRTRIVANMNKYIAPSMRGGMTYINPEHRNKTVFNGGVLDVNSLYPFILRHYEIPFKYVGSTKSEKPNYNKYFIAVIKRLKARVHDDKHPFLKRGTKFTNDKSYQPEIDWTVEYKNGVPNTVLTSVDLIWLYECYTVYEIEFGEIFYYEAEKEFTESVHEHLDFWRKVKENAPKDSVERLNAKMMLNTLWGRWGMFDKEVDDAGVKIQIGDEDTNYVSAIFTTSYARVYLNKAMNWFGKQLIYTDTDSVHYLYDDKIPNKEKLMELLENEIDSKVFGKWDLEKEFKKARYIKSKTYAMELENGEIKTTTSGGTTPKIEDVEDFKIGTIFTNKKSIRDNENRIIIKEYPFTL